MADNSEALELIKGARRKACALYESDQIASPLIKTIALVERVVKGEAKGSALDGDVRRLLDEADYTREQDENRDNGLRSLVIDVCKLVGLATRVISTTNGVLASSSSVNIQETTSAQRDEMVLPKEEPLHDMFTPESSSRGAHDDNPYVPNTGEREQSGSEMMAQQQNPLFTCSPGYSGVYNGDGAIKTEMDDWIIDMSVGDLIDKLPTTSSLSRKRVLHGDTEKPSSSRPKRQRSSTTDRSYADDEDEDEAEEENNEDDHEYGQAKTSERFCKDVIRSDDGFFHCPICDRTYPTLRGLQTHAYAHNTEKQARLAVGGSYPCPKCPKTFHSLRGLQTHDYVHNKAKNCIACGALVKLDNLAKHMNEKHSFLADRTPSKMKDGDVKDAELRTGNATEFFICHCGHESQDQTGFNIHARTHNMEAPYQCPHCLSTLISAKQRNRHIRTIHKREPHECGTCSLQFSKLHHLVAHLKADNHRALMEYD